MIPDVTYFILDYNPNHREQESKWLKECLESVHDNTEPSLSKMVYVVSQGNDDDHEDYVIKLARYLGFNALCMRKNLGVSRGINHCVRMSRSPVVALVTSDTVLTRGMDVDLWSRVYVDDAIMQATPLTQKSDIPYQQHIPEESFGVDSISKLPRNNVYCIAYELTVNFWNRKIFEEIGFFDEQWKACYENLDFSLRSFMAGWDSIISGSSFVWHRHNTCYHNGLLDHAYDGYMDELMPNGLSHTLLGGLWRKKWPGLDAILDVYQPYIPGEETESLRDRLCDTFTDNFHLPYRQNLGY